MERLSMETILQRMMRLDRLEGLLALRREIHDVFLARLASAGIEQWTEQVNEIHDSLVRRAISLSVQRLAGRGAGLPPVPYAFVLLGSGGRREQTLWSDQDNGIIYDDPAVGMEPLAERYFRELADDIVSSLRRIGYPLCDGNVLCSNSKWRMPLSGWITTMRSRIGDPNWENVRYLLIAADLRCVYGKASLVDEYKRQFFAAVRSHPDIFRHMLRNTLHHKVPIGAFGQLIKERYGDDAGAIDVKYGAYIPMVNAIRLLAIEAGLACTSTFSRIRAISEANAEMAGMAAGWTKAFADALKFRAEASHEWNDGVYRSKGMVPAAELSREDRRRMKLCFRTGGRLQKFVQAKFGK